ncbi:hypothetical protein A3F38_01890 [Candidatus Saccharibacteria bacterium RIFCSPHIGHO2_12_FULL_48_21]|nr:MAG: hypothetical protein A3F38_01890 [Candidatus Saccharibacteria bacterium RIFCSPHIGHO2_12_FULL_48_21]
MAISRILQLLLGAVVLMAFVIYFLLNFADFKLLLDINFLLLFIVGIVYSFTIIVNGLYTKYILEAFQKRISIVESTYVSLMTSIGNFFAPIGAGLGFRAFYLKKIHSLPYSDYMSTLYGNYLVILVVNSLAGLLSLLALRNHDDGPYYTLLVFFLAIFLFSLALILTKIPSKIINLFQTPNASRVKRFMESVASGWNRVASDKRLIAQLVFVTTINFLLTFSIIGLIILALNLETTIYAVLLLSALSGMSLFINITPANIGIKEVLYIFSASILGFSVAEMILIALIDRGAQFIVLFALWLLASKLKAKDKLIN